MEVILRDAWLFFKDIVENWGIIAGGLTLMSLGYRQLNKKQEARDQAQEKQLLKMWMEIKRLELLQAIDHDYGLQIVGQIYDEYEKLGGNHYAHEIYEKYKKEKEHENN